MPGQCAHVKVTNFLDMLGLTLCATYRKTLKENGDSFQGKIKNIVGPWLTRRVCLTQRPWSINTYLYPKMYHICHCIPLRKCDIVEIKKQTNRFLYADQLEKPGAILEYRSVQEGGLGLHSMEYKSKALLIKCFLETAVNPLFSHSVYHAAIFHFYVMGDTSIKDPGLPPYFSPDFIDEIKWAISNDNCVETMSSKQWYSLLLNKYLLEEKILDEVDGSLEWHRIKTNTEVAHPDLEWPRVWDLSRMQGLKNETKTFLFRLLNNLHVTGARLHGITLNHPNPECVLCDQNASDDLWRHSFKECYQSQPAMSWIISVVSQMDPNITPSRMITLQFEPTNSDCIRACVWFVSEGMSYIWVKRKAKEPVVMDNLITTMRSNCEILLRSKYGYDGSNLLVLIDSIQN